MDHPMGPKKEAVIEVAVSIRIYIIYVFFIRTTFHKESWEGSLKEHHDKLKNRSCLKSPSPCHQRESGAHKTLYRHCKLVTISKMH